MFKKKLFQRMEEGNWVFEFSLSKMGIISEMEYVSQNQREDISCRKGAASQVEHEGELYVGVCL